MAQRKIRVAILFGGKSAEHDVSRASAANVLRSLDPNRYEATHIGITRDGRWVIAGAGNGISATALAIPDDGPHLARSGRSSAASGVQHLTNQSIATIVTSARILRIQRARCLRFEEIGLNVLAARGTLPASLISPDRCRPPAARSCRRRERCEGRERFE